MRRHIAVLSMVTVLAACSSKPDPYKECVFPDAPDAQAPTWVCGAPYDALALSAIGTSRKLKSGPSMMESVANAEARAKLAAVFSADINERLNNYTKDVQNTQGGESGSNQVIERIQQATQSMTLTNSRTYNTRMSPNGTLYVLVGLDEASYQRNLDGLLKQAALNAETPEGLVQYLQQRTATLDKAVSGLKQY